jgi:hypothetical protein
MTILVGVATALTTRPSANGHNPLYAAIPNAERLEPARRRTTLTDTRRSGQYTVVVRDEVRRQMRLGVGSVQSLDPDLRLSRSDACIQMVVAHKQSDIFGVGDTGSMAADLAKDLMKLCGRDRKSPA